MRYRMFSALPSTLLLGEAIIEAIGRSPCQTDALESEPVFAASTRSGLYMPLSTRAFFAFLTAVSLGLLAAGLVLGAMARLHPCYLCNFQRLLYMVLAVFALGGVVLPAWRKLWSTLVGLTALGGMATAIYQSWMQYAPNLVNECGVGQPTLLEQIVDWLGMRWPSLFMVTGFCTDKDWVFLGLSLANWSVLCFALLLAGAASLFFRRQPS